MEKEIYIPSFFFIIGRSRSGTTLLRLMLDNHKAISIPNECTFILQLSKKYKNINNWTSAIIERFIHDLKKTWLFENLKIDLTELKKKLLENSPEITFKEICLQVILHSESFKKKSGVVYAGDKNPAYSLFFKSIYSIFENNCKYIYIIRDYRDQFWSLKNARFEVPNAFVSAKRWVNAYNNFKSISNGNPKNFYFIKYEDLVNNPEKELQLICSFLGTNYDSSMLNFNDKDRLLSSFSNENLNGIHKSINEPVTNNKINYWKNNLSEKEIKILDKIAGKKGLALGYKPTTKISILQFFIISFPGFFIYWLGQLATLIIKWLPFNVYIKFSGGAYLGRIWNHYFRK